MSCKCENKGVRVTDEDGNQYDFQRASRTRVDPNTGSLLVIRLEDGEEALEGMFHSGAWHHASRI